MSLFNLIGHITEKKTPWDKLTDAERKSMSSFMVTRWLSMCDALTPLVSGLNGLPSELPPQACYELFYYLIPKKKYYLKYIKARKNLEFHEKVITLVKGEFPISKSEAIKYCTFIYEAGCFKEEVTKLAQLHGVSDKDLKSMLKVKRHKK